MTTKRWLLMVVTTAVVSTAATIVAGLVLEDEAPVLGALPVTMRSTALGEDREFFVHLPERYEEDTAARYPVLYVLDGTSQSAHTAESARLLARIGMIPPMIVVGVPSLNGETRNRDYTPPELRLDTDAPTSAMGEADRFLSFLQTELMGRIDQEYRTTRPRMLAGWSRGGLFVVYSAVAAPSLFDARFAHSPALWREDDRIVTRLHEALTGGTLSAGLLYLSLGDQENEKMTASFRHAVTVLERDAPATFKWRADLSAGGQHESNPHLSTPVGLCVMFAIDQSCEGSGIRVAGRPLAAQQPVAADGATRRR
jgi:predicted alpha/beta superfamily hydrolase